MYHKDIMIQGIAEQFKGILRLQGKKTQMVPENKNLQKIHNPSSPLTLSLFLSFFYLLPSVSSDPKSSWRFDPPHCDQNHKYNKGCPGSVEFSFPDFAGPSLNRTGGSHHGVIATWANITKAVNC